jgi:N-acetylglucosamine-6-phosphate deacetylase
MPTLGAADTEFVLGGTRIRADGGRLTGPDGTLAGAQLDMASAVGNATRMMGIELAVAARMASANPARVLGLAGERGTIAPGLAADLVLLGADGEVLETWIDGRSDRA